MSRIQKFRMFNAGENANMPSSSFSFSENNTARAYNPYNASTNSMMPRMGYGYNRMNTMQSPTAFQRVSTGNAQTVTPTKTQTLGSGQSRRSITGESFNVPMTKRAKAKKTKEPLCDCGMPISKCQCEGHNHKENVGSSMRKSMCKCGSGMSKSMCKCGGNMNKSFAKKIKLKNTARAVARRAESLLNPIFRPYAPGYGAVYKPKAKQSKLTYYKKPVVEFLERPELTNQEKLIRGIKRVQGIPTETSRMARNFFGNILTNIGNVPLRNLVTVPMKPRKKSDFISEYVPASGLDDGTKRVFFTTAMSEATRPTRARMMRMLSPKNRKNLKTALNITQFGVLPLGAGYGLGRAYANTFDEKEKSSSSNSSMKKSITRMGRHVVGGYRGKSISKAMKSSQTNLSNKYM